MVVVYDLETLKSAFTYTDINIETKIITQFVIHKDRDNSRELFKYLTTVKGQIGYNNCNFDYPILHFFILYYKSDFQFYTTEKLIEALYNKAQEIIEEQNKDFSQRTYLKESNYFIKQLDLFKIWHFNNKAKSTGLKALEISMNYPNVMECSIPFNKEDISLEEITEILEYNLNDVLATYEFYKLTDKLGKVELRKSLKKEFSLPCTNWNNGKIGEELILSLYCKETGLNPYEVKKLRSKRDFINLKDCIPSLIKFKSQQFNDLISYYSNKTITETKGSVDYSVIYKGIKYFYGTGGLHAAIKSGIYTSNNTHIIKSLDVASLYPNLPIVFNFWIEHLGETFLKVYKDNIVDVRLSEKKKPKKDQNKCIIDGYKEAANIPYGKSNEETSFLYDPLYTLKTTISGQLVITMLAERLSEIPDSQILMVNTDGLEILIPIKYQKLYENMCRDWEILTKLTLEFVDYSKMWIGDINNYGCISFDGKIKSKGRFEVDKMLGSEPAYHKDNSFRIVPLAVQEYFVNNTPVEITIQNHTNIYDFCGRQKFKRDSCGQTNELRYDLENNPYNYIEHQQKNVRYYISNKGKSFVKKYNKGSLEVINKGFEVTIFNKYVEKPFIEYDINYQFYIKECYKEIDQIQTKQLSLF